MAKLGQRTKWMMDAVLFVGFVVALALDLTGLWLHQWLGIALAALAAGHLLAHRQWVASVTRRFTKQAGGRVRLYYVVDAALLAGFAAVTVTGVAMSTWLNLPLADYDAWRVAHVGASLGTLWLVVLKVSLHWRWVAGVARRHLLPAPAPRPVAVPATAQRPGVMRRDFLRLAGTVGALAAVASASVLKGGTDAQASTTDVLVALPPTNAAPATAATAAPATTAAAARPLLSTQSTLSTATAMPAAPAATATVVPTATTAAAQASSCTVRCPRGCSAPGRCRRYADANGNGKCDLGECL